MLLNAVLTVRAHARRLAQGQGLGDVHRRRHPRPQRRATSRVVFLLWGAYAQKKAKLIDTRNGIVVLTAAHPSPLSAKKFFGSKPFSEINAALEELGEEPIDWQLPNLTDAPPKAKPALAPPPQPSVVVAAPAEPVGCAPARRLAEGVGRRVREDVLPQVGEVPRCRAAGTRRLPHRGQGVRGIRPDAVRPGARGVPGRRAVSSQGGGAWAGLLGAAGASATLPLRHIFQELRTDIGCRIPDTGCLTPWAERGVLLLNEVLTVRGTESGSHTQGGWETFTDAVVRALRRRPKPLVFLLCGEAGARKERLIDRERHGIVRVPEPEDEEFLGSRPFSAVNDALERQRAAGDVLANLRGVKGVRLAAALGAASTRRPEGGR